MLFQKDADRNEFTKVEAGYPLQQTAKLLGDNIVLNLTNISDLSA